MNEQEDPDRQPGCPPHEFGNRLAWKWTREMPAALKGGFLTLLYAMRAMSSADGQLRFSGDGRPIRIQDIAAAAGSREQDTRRYLEAAMRAGVVATVGERRRGKPTLYVLVNCPWPTWQAAAAYLRQTARTRKTDDQSSGRSGLNSGREGSGHSGTNSEQEVRAAAARTDSDPVRATAARMGSDHSGTNGSGHSGPNNPGVNHEEHQERVDVVPQLQKRAGEEAEDDSPQQQEETGPAGQPDGKDVARRFCACGQRLMRPDRTKCGGCLKVEADAKARREAEPRPVQGAFLLPFAGGGQGVPSARRERTPQDPSAPAGAPYLTSAPSGPGDGLTGLETAAHGSGWPGQDGDAPLRVCDCGREHRAKDVRSRCPDCLWAEHEQARTATG